MAMFKGPAKTFCATAIVESKDALVAPLTPALSPE